MECPNCGSENRDAAKFCDECGFPLGGAIARFAASIPPSDSASDEDISKASVETEEVSQGMSPGEGSLSPMRDDRELGGADANDGPEPDGSFKSEGEMPQGESLEPGDEVAGDESASEAKSGEAGAGVAEEREGDAVAPVDYSKVSNPDITRPISSLLDDATSVEELESDAQGAVSESEGDDARVYTDDDFAGFTRHSDDGYSFSDALSFDDSPNPLNTQGPGFTMKMPRVEGEEKEKSRDYMASVTVPKKSHAKTIGIIAGVIAVVALVAIVTFTLGLWGGKVVPDVTDMTESDARAILEQSGFTVRSTQVKSDDTEGLVLIMDPDAGSRIPDGSEVVIHVASALLIPDIIGKTSEEAAALLAEAGYDNISYEKVRSDGDEDLVLAVSPGVGERAKSSMEVVVEVSEAFRVPDISGLSWDDAFAAIEDAGLVPQVIYINTEYYIEGTIIGTTPEAGTVVSEGAYVSVNVAQSRGALLVSLTQNLLVPGSTVNVNGYNFTIDALNAVSYLGNDTVAFSFTGRPYVALFGEVIHSGSQTVNGQVVWSASNEVVSIT